MVSEVFIRDKIFEYRKAQNKALESVYMQVLNKILVAEKSGKYPEGVPESVVTDLMKKEVKEMEETLSFYNEENSTTAELRGKIDELKKYLPKELTEEQVTEIIIRLSKTEPNKGKLVGLVCKEVGSNFDRSKVKPLVDKTLGGN